MTSHLILPDGSTVPVRDGLLIGRVAGCDVVVDDTKASRKHARIRDEGGVVEIEDLGSSNGTLLNGKPVDRRMLRDGDEVQIGATVLVFRSGNATAVAAATAAADDVDLFGDEPSATSSPSPPRTAAPIAAPPVAAPSDPPIAASAPPPPAAPVRPPAPAAPPPPRVVEFADEVIEVRAAPRPSVPTPAAAPAGQPMIQQRQRVLQFAKTAERAGPLGDDLAQMNGGLRLLLTLLVLAGGAGVAWLAMTLVS